MVEQNTIPNCESASTAARNTCQLDPAHAVQLSRRDFLRLGVGVLSVIAALEVGGATLLYFRSHSLSGNFGGIVTAGRVEDFPPGSVSEFLEERFFLVRAPDGGFLALHSRCPHLGCTVTWQPEEGRFLCPCHGADFDRYGADTHPPVPRPLDVFDISIERGLVKVDTTRLYPRTHHSALQLTYV